MAVLNPVTANAQLGPVYSRQIRDKYAHALSETPSLTDRIIQDKSAQILTFTDYKLLNPIPVPYQPEPEQVIASYKPMVEEHIQRRVLFQFQQLIVCYQTKLHFESVGAQDQAESATAVQVKIQGHLYKLTQRQAAHSCTSPCLVAYDNALWQQYVQGTIEKPQGFVFLKDTDYYRTANATMNMPKWINDADREIDEKTTESLLRQKSEVLINRVSQGELTPDKGILVFLEDAIDEVDSALERLEEDGEKPEVQSVLRLYRENLENLQEEIQEDPAFLQTFLNLKIDPSTGDAISKKTLLEMRYAAIRNAHIEQAKLMQKVDALRDQLRGFFARKPDHFQAALNTLLVTSGRTDICRQRLEKLCNFSPFNYEAQLTGSNLTKYNKTKTQLSEYLDTIKFVALDILEDMRHLRTQEVQERARILKKLRTLNNWSQTVLGKKLETLFPFAASSQTTISRIERGEKLVTPPIAEEFSQVFKVDPGLFMPHFFYD